MIAENQAIGIPAYDRCPCMLELCTTLCKHCRTSQAVQRLTVARFSHQLEGLGIETGQKLKPWIVLVFFRSSRPQLLLKCHLQCGEDVLVINRARLLSDSYFTTALNAMKHPNYPPLGQETVLVPLAAILFSNLLGFQSTIETIL